ncbi:MAG: PLP-dependent cysteine synthase family protein [Fimbriimonadaceae bacterium]|nr:PLP-dependent cysteine synthase family protein [Fimbriimonadaceae bacterium]
MNIGNTPVWESGGIIAKLECLNTLGSVKDRIAHYILVRSKKLGLLKAGQTVVEATSGNTGIAVAYWGRELGHPVTIVMPENMTEERKSIIRALGADLILCSEEGSFAEAAEIRNRLAEERGWFNPDQFSNPLNVECHEQTTGAELIGQISGRELDAFVAGIGTGGTLVGVGQALKQHYPDICIVAVEPEESAVMSGGGHRAHSIFGIGDGFIPPIASNGNGGLNPVIDSIIVVSSAEALSAAHELQEKFGLCVGISSGANYAAAKRLRKRFATVATLFADGYSKYVSHGLVGCQGVPCPFLSLCEQRQAERAAILPGYDSGHVVAPQGDAG